MAFSLSLGREKKTDFKEKSDDFCKKKQNYS